MECYVAHRVFVISEGINQCKVLKVEIKKITLKNEVNRVITEMIQLLEEQKTLRPSVIVKNSWFSFSDRCNIAKIKNKTYLPISLYPVPPSK